MEDGALLLTVVWAVAMAGIIPSHP